MNGKERMCRKGWCFISLVVYQVLGDRVKKRREFLVDKERIIVQSFIIMRAPLYFIILLCAR